MHRLLGWNRGSALLMTTSGFYYALRLVHTSHVDHDCRCRQLRLVYTVSWEDCKAHASTGPPTPPGRRTGVRHPQHQALDSQAYWSWPRPLEHPCSRPVTLVGMPAYRHSQCTSAGRAQSRPRQAGGSVAPGKCSSSTRLRAGLKGDRSPANTLPMRCLCGRPGIAG